MTSVRLGGVISAIDAFGPAPRSDWRGKQVEANDFHHRYPEDLALLAELGVTVVRLGFDWARLQPAPGAIDDDWREWYEHVLEAQRLLHAQHRQTLETEAELLHHDDLWSQHLERVTQYRAGLHFLSYSGADPLPEYLRTIHQWFSELPLQPPDPSEGPLRRGATWTYLSTDQPFGTPFSRMLRSMLATLRVTMKGIPRHKV